MSSPFRVPFDGPGGLVGLMKGKDSLSGWDVLVSYDNVQLNALLADRARELNLDSPDSWDAVDKDPFTGEERTIVFDVKLLQPTLQFVDVSNNISVTFGLAGQYHVKDSTKLIDLPSGLTCELTTSLVNVAGQWHDDGWKPAEGEQTHGDGYVVVLEPAASVARGICIDLAHCKATLGQAPGFDIPDSIKAHLTPLIGTFIERHFSQHGLRLCLAAINNHFDVSDENSRVLQPTHFCFTVAGGVLMTWIGLKGGPDTGTRPSGQTSLSFAPSSSALSPIPEGSTASIIFSHSTMANLFLGPSLKASPGVNGELGVACTSVKTDNGMKFAFTLKSHAITIDAEDSRSWGGHSHHLDGCTVDLNEKTCALAVDGDTRPVQDHSGFNLSWTSNTKTVKSNEWVPNASGHGGSYSYSSCQAYFTYNGTGQWRGSTDPVHHPNQLGMNWTLDSTLSTHITADKPDFWDTIGGKKGEIPGKYRDLKPSAPQLDLTLKPLDYFLTTNLLLPGQHAFHADNPVPASANVQAGIATPRDTILTGNVATNMTAHVKRLTAMRDHRTFLGESTEPGPAAGSTLDDLKNAYLAFPSNKVLGDFFRHTASKEPTLSTRDLLEQYGFGNLANENMLALWGTSIEELLGEKTDMPRAELSSVDLRIYADYYVVTAPPDDSGEQFFVHPLTGAIRMGNKNIVPEQAYDAENKRVMVTWKMPTGATYSVWFSVVLDQERYVLGTKCEGTIVQQGDDSAPQRFEAFRKGYLPTLSTAEAESIHLLDGNDSETSAAAIIGMIAAGVTIIGQFVAIGVFLWNKKETTKELALKTAVVADQKDKIDRMQKATESNVAKAAKEEYNHHAAARDNALEELQKRVDKVAEAELKAIIANGQDVLQRMANDPTYQKEVRDRVAEVATKEMKQEAPKALHDVTKLVLDACMAAEPYGSMFKLNERNEMVDIVQKLEFTRALDHLNGRPSPDSLTFGELAGQKAIEFERAEAARKELGDLTKVREGLEKTLHDKHTAAEAHKNDAYEKAKKEWEKSQSPENTKKYDEAKTRLAELENERKTAEAEHTKAREKEHESHDRKVEREREEHRSREREHHKREHAL